MAEDDWMTADVNVPQSKFQDEDKPEEKKVIKKEETKETKSPAKKKLTIDEKAAERQKKLVISEAEMRALEEKYKHLPEKERVLKVQEEVEKLLAKFVFSDVLKTGQQLASREDFLQLGKSVAFVMRNSGKEYLIPAFFEELLNCCKADLTHEQIKGIGDIAMRISNEKYQEQKRKDEKKTKGPKASLKAGKGLADQKLMVKALVHQDNFADEGEAEEFDAQNDFM